MNPNRLKTFNLFFFALFFQFVMYKFMIMPSLYDNYGNNGILFFLIAILITIALFFIPDKYFKSLFNNKATKVLLGIAALINVAVQLAIGANVVYKLFYEDASYLIFIIMFVIAIMIITNLNSSQIINLSTSFYIFIPLMLLIAYMFSPKINILAMFNLKGIGFDFFLYSNYALSLIFLLANLEANKKVIILGSIIGSIIYMIEYFMLIGVAGASFFKGYEYVGFITYQIQIPNKYIGNFDFITIISLSLCLIFNVSYYLSISTFCFNLDRKYKNILLIILALISYVLVFFVTWIKKIYLLVEGIMLLFILLYLVIINARNNFKLQKK